MLIKKTKQLNIMFYDLALYSNKSLLKDLGFKEHGLKIHKFKAMNLKELREELKTKADYYVLCESNYQTRRIAAEKALVDCLACLELSKKPDLIHSRRSGMDHKLARFASQSKVAVEFNFNHLLNSKGFERATILGRMMQNARLCKKYKTPIVITSGAKKKSEMRSASDLQSFGIILGFTPKQAKEGLSRVALEMVKKKDFK